MKKWFKITARLTILICQCMADISMVWQYHRHVECSLQVLPNVPWLAPFWGSASFHAKNVDGVQIWKSIANLRTTCEWDWKQFQFSAKTCNSTPRLSLSWLSDPTILLFFNCKTACGLELFLIMCGRVRCKLWLQDIHCCNSIPPKKQKVMGRSWQHQ